MEQSSITAKQFKGLNNVLSEYERGWEWLTTAQNVDIDNDLRIKRRRGSAKIFTGNAHSLWSKGDICLFREVSNLKRLMPDYTATILRTGLTTVKLPMAYLYLAGRVYYSDGEVTGIIENGVSRSWGLDIPPSPRLSSIDGFMRKGRYQVSLVYVREDGQTSGANLPIIIDINDNSGIEISSIVSSEDPTVRNIDIYVSTPDGEILFFYERVPQGTEKVTIKTDVIKLIMPLKTPNLYKPPTGTMLEYYNSRIYVIQNNIVWYSEPFAYELFKLSDNYLLFDSPMTLFGAVQDGIWAATQKETSFLFGDNPPFKRITKADYGAIKGTMQRVDGSVVGEGMGSDVLIWASEKGICLGGDGGTFKNLTEDRYLYSNSQGGAGLFRQIGGLNQFVVALR